MEDQVFYQTLLDFKNCLHENEFHEMLKLTGQASNGGLYVKTLLSLTIV